MYAGGLPLFYHWLGAGVCHLRTTSMASGFKELDARYAATVCGCVLPCVCVHFASFCRQAVYCPPICWQIPNLHFHQVHRTINIWRKVMKCICSSNAPKRTENTSRKPTEYESPQAGNTATSLRALCVCWGTVSKLLHQYFWIPLWRGSMYDVWVRDLACGILGLAFSHCVMCTFRKLRWRLL